MSTDVELVDNCGLQVIPEEPYTNPFLMVYNNIFNMALKDSRFVEVVKKGNRIRFDTSNRDPVKTNPISADYPEVMLIPTGAAVSNLHQTSSSSRMLMNYNWIVSTGDFRYSEVSAVEWALYAAMSKYRCDITTLLWGDNLFVTRFNINGSTIGEQETLKRRGINGWASSWIAEVEMNFSNLDLKNGVTIQ